MKWQGMTTRQDGKDKVNNHLLKMFNNRKQNDKPASAKIIPERMLNMVPRIDKEDDDNETDVGNTWNRADSSKPQHNDSATC